MTNKKTKKHNLKFNTSGVLYSSFKVLAIVGAIIKSYLEAVFQLIWGLAGIFLFLAALVYLKLNGYTEEVPVFIPSLVFSTVDAIINYYTIFLTALFPFYLWINTRK